MQVAVVEVKIASSINSFKQIDFATVQFPQVSRFLTLLLGRASKSKLAARRVSRVLSSIADKKC